MTKTIYFVEDPMCSWCYGFAPTAARIRDAAVGRAETVLVMGGLRPGTEHVMDAALGATIREHWQHVHEASGQPFDFRLFERTDFVYNTEPACRAVVVARAVAPGREVELFERLQRAFYAENVDVTEPATLRDLAGEVGVDAEAFTQRFNSPAAIQETFADFEQSRRMGVQGFPTVVVHDDQANDGHGGYALLTAGFRPYEALGPVLEEWLAA